MCNPLKLIILIITFLPFQNFSSQMIKSELNLDSNDFSEIKIENVGKVIPLYWKEIQKMTRMLTSK